MSSGADTAPRVEARAVSRVYGAGRRDAVTALETCSVSVARGSFVAVRGKSGSGKTTLLRLLAALDRPTAGEILHDGRALSSLSEAYLSALRRDIGLVFQDAAMLERVPVWENVAYPLVPRGFPRRERRSAAFEALGRLDIAHLGAKAPHELSGGERQRVGVARALVAGPSLVVADEPAAHVDDTTAQEVLAVLRGVRERGGTVVVATHREDITAAADHVVRLPQE